MGRTSASNPARIQVQLGHFLRTDGKDLIILVAALLIGGALLAVNWKVALVVAGIGAFITIFSVLQARDLFLNGDVCAAIVLDPERQLVAVLADLSQGGKPAPALKIVSQPLRRALANPIKKGTRLAFVALYSGHPGARTWNNFGGYVAQTGTVSPKAIQRVLNSISEAQWNELLASVRDLDKPYATGLFDLRGKGRDAEGSAPGKVRRAGATGARRPLVIGAAVVLIPILLMAGMALRAKFKGGGIQPPGQIAQGAPDPFPADPEVPPHHRGAPPMPWPPQADGQPQIPPGGVAGQPDAANAPPAPGGEADAANPFRPAGENPAGDNAENPFRPAGGNPDANAGENPFRPAAPPRPQNWQAGQQAEGFLAGEWRPVTIKRVLNPVHIEVTWDNPTDVGPPLLPTQMLRPRGNANP